MDGDITFEYPTVNFVGSTCPIESMNYSALEILRIEEEVIPNDENINDIFIKIKMSDYTYGYLGSNFKKNTISYVDFKKLYLNNIEKELIELYNNNQRLIFSLIFKESNMDGSRMEEKIESSKITKIKFKVYYRLIKN